MNEIEARLLALHGKGNCHICGMPKAGEGSLTCSYPHAMLPDKPIKGADGMWSWVTPRQGSGA